MAQLYAVLTGDIVGSRTLGPEMLERLRRRLADGAEEIASWAPETVVGGIEFFRGDAWQLAIARPEFALRAAIYFRALSQSRDALGGRKPKVDTRIAIGLGQAKLDERRISRSVGEAFELSGLALDELKGHARMTVRLPASVGPLAQWLPVVGELCDALVQSWARRQAEIVALMAVPNPPRQEDLAARVQPHVTQQAVTKALRGAHWEAVAACIRCFETTPWYELAAGKQPF